MDADIAAELGAGGSVAPSAAWFTRVLGRGAARVLHAEISRDYSGHVATTHRARLRWDTDAMPTAVVVKVVSAHPPVVPVACPGSVEVAFYRDIAAAFPVRLPACHAAFDVPGECSVVVLDDLSPARPADELAGCTAEQAAAALTAIARAHARADLTSSAPAWLRRPDWTPHQRALVVRAVTPTFLATYGERLSPAARKVVSGCGRALWQLPTVLGPTGVVHNDFRVSNVLFGDGPPAVLDWQTVSVGPVLGDVAYLLATSLTTEDRRANEWELVDAYVRELCEAGAAVTTHECWDAYCRLGMLAVSMAVVGSAVAARSSLADDLFVCMVERAARFVVEEAEAGAQPRGRRAVPGPR